MIKNILFFSIIALVQFAAFGQNCERVLVSGKVVDSIRPQGFYNLMVVNRTTGQGVFGQPNGSFSVYANNNDSISLSVRGYDVINLVVKADSNCQFRNTIGIIGKAQEFEEVVIRPLKTLEQIREEREGLAMRETRMVTGLEVLQSPITALYQTFSKKEKAKRWIAKQEYKDDQEQLLKELLRTYVAYDIVELSNEEFEEFVRFLNIDDVFLKTASEMELITFIKDKFQHYKSFKKGGKSTYFDVQR